MAHDHRTGGPPVIGGEPYTVTAVNTAHASENKIHDDDVARRLGFSGGLVPGVDVYAYATHAALARWGRAWLDRGTMDFLLKKPVYEGRLASVFSQERDGALHVAVESEGALCLTGVARLPAAVEGVPGTGDFPAVVPPEERPDATAETLPPGTPLGSHPFTVTPAVAAQYLHDIEERDALYADAGLVHPGQVLRICNWVLAHSVRMGAWIHAGSKVRHIAAAHVGDELTGRGMVVAEYERKGHRFVDLDVLVVAGAGPVACVTHTAIYRPRQLGEDGGAPQRGAANPASCA